VDFSPHWTTFEGTHKEQKMSDTTFLSVCRSFDELIGIISMATLPRYCQFSELWLDRHDTITFSGKVSFMKALKNDHGCITFCKTIRFWTVKKLSKSSEVCARYLLDVMSTRRSRANQLSHMKACLRDYHRHSCQRSNFLRS
jgi:hypothetical protein